MQATQTSETAALRARLSRLSEASQRINESLDLHTVLQEIVDGARALTHAQYGVITTCDDDGQPADFLASGLTAAQSQHVWDMPAGLELFAYLYQLSGPLRVPDLAGHVQSLGLSGFSLPIATGAFLTVPIRHRGEAVGNIGLAKQAANPAFTQADEETLVMFASQAALVIANARRYQAEQRVRTDLETLINTSPVGVLVFNARTGAMVSHNREVQRLVDILSPEKGTVESLLEELTLRRMDGQSMALDEFSRAQHLRTEKTVRAEEMIFQVPSGRTVSTLVNATPIMAADGQVETVVVTLQDLAPLEELARLRVEFLAMVSHELRRPLTSIKGSATTLRHAATDLDPAEMGQFFRIIDEQADHMRDLISNLLDVARIESGHLAVAPAPTTVLHLVDAARNAFLSGGGRHSLHIDLPPDLPRVMADPRRIVQVLHNLLVNAARFAPETTPIRLTACCRDVHVAITVTDRGRGITAEHLPRLFRKFTRRTGEDQVRTGGTGLGLAICKGLVEAHGGRIWAESDGRDRGARFTFTLPQVVAETPVVDAGDAARTAKPALTHILTIDDDPQVLRSVRNTLTQAGFTALGTGDPQDVPRLLEQHPVALVLLDLVLPGTDGLALMQDIHARNPLPVIFLSGYGRDQIIAQAFALGAADYVVKPFSPTELVARIQAALRRSGSSPGPAPFQLGDLFLDYTARTVSLAGRPVALTTTEYALLAELARHAGRSLTHAHLLQRIWSSNHSNDPRLVRTVVKRLRRKLDDDARRPTYIWTVPGVGYRLAKPTNPTGAG